MLENVPAPRLINRGTGRALLSSSSCLAWCAHVLEGLRASRGLGREGGIEAIAHIISNRSSPSMIIPFTHLHCALTHIHAYPSHTLRTGHTVVWKVQQRRCCGSSRGRPSTRACERGPSRQTGGGHTRQRAAATAQHIPSLAS